MLCGVSGAVAGSGVAGAGTGAWGFGGFGSLYSRVSEQLRFQLLQVKTQFKLNSFEETLELAQLRRSSPGKNLLLWDKDGFRKLLVVSTDAGKLLALHNGDGRVVWSRYYGEGATLDSLLVWDTPHTMAAAPQLLVLLSRQGAGGGGGATASWVDGHTGAQLRVQELPWKPQRVLDAATLLGARCVVLVGPAPARAVHTLHAPVDNWDSLWEAGGPILSFLDADPAAGVIGGWGIRRGGAVWTARPLWSAVIGAGERLAALAPRKREEAVHSQVRVLGSRAVLFKYLNPNLALVAVEAPSSAGAGTDVVVYLLDTVTGHVVYQVRHAAARGPVHAILSENWAVYSLWSASAHRYELCSLELYDDAATKRRRSIGAALVGTVLGGNETTWASSLAPPAVRVLGQSFYLPLSVSQLAVTATARGITPKQLLLGTPGGQVLAYDRRFLDPRRPLTPTQEDREEGLIQYSDTLPIVPAAFATYNKAVARLRQIETAPARLESTSLVFVHGLDLFFTRVMPSRTYDLLTDDFSYGLLSLTILTLLVFTVVSQRMMGVKDLAFKWK